MSTSPAHRAVRMPAHERRAVILDAAAAEFAETGLAGTRLETIAAGAGISHPRVVQMFGSKRALFLDVLERVFDRIEADFAAAALSARRSGDKPALVALGERYRRLLRRDRTVGLLMLQGYAAAADETVREVMRRRYLKAQNTVHDLTGADALQVRSFFATGLVVTVSTVLELPDRRADATWAAGLLQLDG